MMKHHFIDNVSHWNSYLPLLWEALEATKGDVIELGVGDGSTNKLHEYCRSNSRKLFSYESNEEWYRQFERFNTVDHRVEYVGNNWLPMIEKHRGPVGVLFSDEAPGEQRKFNISMFCNTAQIIVAHDTEQRSDGGYKFSLVKPLFRYMKHHQHEGADATAFSNFIDVSKWEL